MKGFSILSIFYGSLLLALLPGKVRAQTYAAVEIGILIPEIVVLQPDVSPPLTFDFSSTTALDNGMTITGTSLRYYSNKSFYVLIQAGSDFFSGGQGSMPASVLKYKTGQSASFTDLTSGPVPLTGSPASKRSRGTGTFTLDFRMDPGYLHPPADNYSITIVYTLTNQ